MKLGGPPLFNNGWKPCVPGGEGLPADNEEVIAIFPIHDSLQQIADVRLVLEPVIYKSPAVSPAYWWSSTHRTAVHPVCWRSLPEWPEGLDKDDV